MCRFEGKIRPHFRLFTTRYRRIELRKTKCCGSLSEDDINSILPNAALGVRQNPRSLFPQRDCSAIIVSSNVSVDVESAQRSVHEAAETWIAPTQAWTKSLERKMLPTAGDRQDFYAKCLFSDPARRFVHAYFGHFLALFETFSTFALRNVQ